ncbi:hypothetical protein BCR44DRAFT_1329694 [Catenaria anguillulae PL171]|uniref:C3H1-type domain-containing protein n=1 Tax=Catenaria anguillulae PL171 TaxID=765915 RepID=A0A1Y2H883_9FUNG|nr:hypothetical protein BCR44DRAFT_1329694 [Catenaria anguillulae PL171]
MVEDSPTAPRAPAAAILSLPRWELVVAVGDLALAFAHTRPTQTHRTRAAPHKSQVVAVQRQQATSTLAAAGLSTQRDSPARLPHSRRKRIKCRYRRSGPKCRGRICGYLHGRTCGTCGRRRYGCICDNGRRPRRTCRRRLRLRHNGIKRRRPASVEADDQNGGGALDTCTGGLAARGGGDADTGALVGAGALAGAGTLAGGAIASNTEGCVSEAPQNGAGAGANEAAGTDGGEVGLTDGLAARGAGAGDVGL